MKKYMIITLMMLPLLVGAESTSTKIGEIKTFTGSRVVFYVGNNDGSKLVYMLTSDKYRIRKTSIGMSKSKAIELRRILNDAISKMD